MGRFAVFLAALAVAVASSAVADAASAAPRARDVAARSAALGEALERGDAEAVQAAARALAARYWRDGWLAEAAAAFATAGADPDAEPLYALVLLARGRPVDAEARVSARAALGPGVVAPFIVIGVDAEAGREPGPLALAEAANAAEDAPAWAKARFAAPLADAAAAAGAARLAQLFAGLAETHADPAEAAFARGRVAEALFDQDAALRAYAEAGSGRGRWAAEARLREAALLWADGRSTPVDMAQVLERLMVDWGGDHVALKALPALARMYLFSARPALAAEALALAASRYRDGPGAAEAARAAARLDELLEAVFVENRYPELSLTARVELYGRARPYAAAALGALEADAAHLDALAAADLHEEVLAVTDLDPDAFPKRRAGAVAALERMAARGPLWPDAGAAHDFAPFFAPPAAPRRAPEAMAAAPARAALTGLDARRGALEATLEELERAGDLAGAPS